MIPETIRNNALVGPVVGVAHAVQMLSPPPPFISVGVTVVLTWFRWPSPRCSASSRRRHLPPHSLLCSPHAHASPVSTWPPVTGHRSTGHPIARVHHSLHHCKQAVTSWSSGERARSRGACCTALHCRWQWLTGMTSVCVPAPPCSVWRRLVHALCALCSVRCSFVHVHVPLPTCSSLACAHCSVEAARSRASDPESLCTEHWTLELFLERSLLLLLLVPLHYCPGSRCA